MSQFILEVAISNLMVSTAIAFVAVIVTRIWRNQQLAHLLWLLVLAKLVTPPLWNVTLPSLAQSDRSSPVDVASTDLETAPNEAAMMPLPFASEVTHVAPAPQASHSTSRSVAHNTTTKQSQYSRTSTDATDYATATLSVASYSLAQATQFVSHHARTIVAVWFVTSALYLLFVAIRVARFNELLRSTSKPDDSLRMITADLAKRLHLSDIPNIRLTDAAVGPLVWSAARRPLLLLPERLVRELGREQLSTILAHELAHLKRLDHWVRFLETAVVALYWWNPLVWFVRRELHTAEEMCCDAHVVDLLPNNAGVYGDALLRTNQFLSSGCVPAPALASGIRNQGSLKRRVEMILRNKLGTPMSRQTAAVAALFAMVVLPFAGTGILAEDKDESKNETTKPALRATNLDFEDGTRGGSWPNGWYGGGKGYKLSTDTSVFHEGKASGKIERVEAGKHFGTLTSGDSADKYKGKRIKFTGFLRTDEAEAAGLWMRFDDRSGDEVNVVAFDNMMGRPVNGTTDWTQYAVVLDVPAEATHFNFGFLIHGGGTVWGDDLNIEVVGEIGEGPEPTGVAPSTLARVRQLRAAKFDFEGGTRDNGFPMGWGGGGDGYKLGLDSEVAHQGKASGRIEQVEDGAVFASLTRGIAINKYRGKRVKYSGFLRSKEAQHAGLWMRIDDRTEGETTTVAFDNMSRRPVKGTQDWKEYSVVLDVPQDADAMTFGFLLHGKGILWADDLKIEIVGNAGDGPKTTGLESAALNAHQIANFENMDFEAGLNKHKYPDHWGGGGVGYELTVDNNKAKSGSASGQIKRTGDGGQFGSLTRVVPAKPFHGKRIVYTGYLSTEDADLANLWLRIDAINNGKPEPIDFANTAKQAAKGTTDWTEHTIVIDVPDDARNITFGFLLTGEGTVWGDDLKIEAVADIGQGPETNSIGREQVKKINEANGLR